MNAESISSTRIGKKRGPFVYKQVFGSDYEYIRIKIGISGQDLWHNHNKEKFKLITLYLNLVKLDGLLILSLTDKWVYIAIMKVFIKVKYIVLIPDYHKLWKKDISPYAFGKYEFWKDDNLFSWASESYTGR